MKSLFATLALATFSLGAFATEATQFTDAPASTLSRAQLAAAQTGPVLARQIGDATVFVDPVMSEVSRAEVRAQATAATLARTHAGATYGEASVSSVM